VAVHETCRYRTEPRHLTLFARGIQICPLLLHRDNRLNAGIGCVLSQTGSDSRGPSDHSAAAKQIESTPNDPWTDSHFMEIA
jgi:hypothetical protein